MRATLLRRTVSADPFTTHVGERTAFWAKVRAKLAVNPSINSGSPLVLEHRWPQPGSRPERFTVPASRASDVAQNPYHDRDFRRMYPTTAVVTQGELATLLIAQGGFTALPAPPAASTASTELTADSPTPTLSALYSAAPATAAFKPPLPPTRKVTWTPSTGENAIPHGEFAYFPMTAYSATTA